MARVLIVDDNQTMAELISRVVELRGHMPLIAHSGRQALEVVAEQGPDLMLLDLMMPDMDGMETLRRLRAMPSGHKLPVIVVSALEEEDVQQQVIRAGGNAYLQKPVDTKPLLDLIASMTTDS